MQRLNSAPLCVKRRCLQRTASKLDLWSVCRAFSTSRTKLKRPLRQAQEALRSFVLSLVPHYFLPRQRSFSRRSLLVR